MSDLEERLKALEDRVRHLERLEHHHGFISLGVTQRTINQGAITIDRAHSVYEVDTEGGAASDDLDFIYGGVEGDVIFITAANSARDVVCKDGTGNLKLPADMTLDNVEDIEELYCNGTDWLEVTASSNL